MSKGNGKTRTHALELRVRNVKRIREVSIGFDGEIHEIRGDAGEGKTTILESIKAAFEDLDPKMVRQGADKGEIELVLDNAVVKRITSADGSTRSLMVTRDGKPIPKKKDAEAFLRAICDGRTFDPLYWVQLGSVKGEGATEARRKQRDMLLAAIKVGITEDEMIAIIREKKGDVYIDALSEVNLDNVTFDQHGLAVCKALWDCCYKFRGQQNALEELAKNKLEILERPKRPAPKATLQECHAAEQAAIRAHAAAEQRMTGRGALSEKADSLRAKIAEENKTLPDLGKLGRTYEHYEKESSSAGTEIERLKAEITKLTLQLREQEARQTEAQAKLSECEGLNQRIEANDARRRDLEKLESELMKVGEVIDLGVYAKALAEAQADREARQMQDALDTAAKEFEAAQARATLFTELVNFFWDELPKMLLEKSNLRIEGLGIDAEGITIRAVPLHQLGTSEQIRIGVQVFAALYPNCGFLPIDRAESIGRADRGALAQIASELDLQLMMTIVDADAVPSKGVTVMRDGEAVTPAA